MKSLVEEALARSGGLGAPAAPAYAPPTNAETTGDTADAELLDILQKLKTNVKIIGCGGAGSRSISFHETHEWDPSLLNDGRVIYTRWDYVDRNAVHYQQLWSALPDGGNAQIYYGNNTWNPTGIWEARAVPGSSRIMATAAPHHGMSAVPSSFWTRRGVSTAKSR